MPADLNGGESAFLSSSSRGRHIESKRLKGEASCAECRRLKLRCDRKIPCTSCVRRGCQIICPNGSLTSGQGSRFVLANTDKLHDKLLQMSRRIRQLEDALQISHAANSLTVHPLLAEDLLTIKSGVDIIKEQERLDDEADDVTGISSDLGTLRLSEGGDATFLGRSSSEALLMVMDEAAAEQADQARLPDDVAQASKPLESRINLISEAFPFAFGHLPKARLLEMIESHLPTYARATALAEAYLGNIAWSFRVVGREQIFEELLPAVYKRRKEPPPDGDDLYEGDYVHRLALLLGVLASGAQGDLTLPIGSAESELYNKLARATLSLKSVFVSVSMETVQTIMMLAGFDFNSCKEESLEPAWRLMSFALSLSASIGLHRDPARWMLEPKLVQRRRLLFWEIYYVDKWKSLESGRPAMYNANEVDCEFPEDKEATIDENGKIVPSFWDWKYQYTRDVLAPISEQLSLARRLKYSEILELDRKLREFEFHPSLSLSRPNSTEEDVAVALRRFYWTVVRQMTLLHIHRNVFARALLENPPKPLGSPYASSLLSAYASAMTLLRMLRAYYDKFPDLLIRQWVIWAHGLTSAVIIGTIACRGPAGTACRALGELELAVELFREVHMHPVAKKSLPFLLRLLERARNATQAVPREAVISSRELTVLGGAPILLTRPNRRSSAPPSSNGSGMRNVVNGAGPTRSSSPPESNRTSPCTSPLAGHDIAPWTSQQYLSIPASLDEVLFNNLGNVWDPSLTNTLPEISPSFMTNFPPGVPPAGQGQNNVSSSWLEELINGIPPERRRGVDDANAAVLNLNYLTGLAIGSDPAGIQRPERENDPHATGAYFPYMTG